MNEYYILNRMDNTFEKIPYNLLKDYITTLKEKLGNLEGIEVIQSQQLNGSTFLSGDDALSLIEVTPNLKMSLNRIKNLDLQYIINEYCGNTLIALIKARAKAFDDEDAMKCREWLRLNNMELGDL